MMEMTTTSRATERWWMARSAHLTADGPPETAARVTRRFLLYTQSARRIDHLFLFGLLWSWMCILYSQELVWLTLPQCYREERGSSEAPRSVLTLALHSNLNCLKIGAGRKEITAVTPATFLYNSWLAAVYTGTSTAAGQCLGQLHKSQHQSRLKKSTFLLFVKQQQQTDQDTTRRRGAHTDFCPVSSNGSADHLRPSQKRKPQKSLGGVY